MPRFPFNHPSFVLGALVFTLMACSAKEEAPGATKGVSPEAPEVSESNKAQVEKAPVEKAQVKPSKAPSLRVPVVPVDLKAVSTEGNILVLTGTVAIYNDGEPVEWECPKKTCTLESVIKTLAIEEKEPLRIAVSPEIGARELTHWVLSLIHI